MDQKLIKSLIKMLDDSTINEIEIEEEGTYIRLVKNAEQVVMPATAVAQAPVAPFAQATQVQVSNEAPAETSTPVVAGNVIEAPLVGTFYGASSPDAAPFVKVGDTVKSGDVVCIIESMKVMNEITSSFDGVVKEIKVNNEDLVEFGQALIVIG
jgi:acetyl-CoA carboxylase biotin carboxyl carrier protein